PEDTAATCCRVGFGYFWCHYCYRSGVLDRGRCSALGWRCSDLDFAGYAAGPLCLAADLGVAPPRPARKPGNGRCPATGTLAHDPLGPVLPDPHWRAGLVSYCRDVVTWLVGILGRHGHGVSNADPAPLDG